MKSSNDSHVHMTIDDDLKSSAYGFELYRQGSGIDRIAFLGLNPVLPTRPCAYNQNAKCLYLKEYFKEKGYAGFSLEYFDKISADGFLDQLKMGYEAGFDCWKVIEGKPNIQKILGFSLDDEIYDKTYDFAEQKGIPVIMHVADPEWLWEKELKDGYHSRKYYQDQAVNVLKKHPDLKLNLAHFGFMSDMPDRVVELFNQYPSLCFDTVPAPEEFFEMSKNPKVWREIFIEYNQRYMFGSDRGNHTAKGMTEAEFHKVYPTDSAPYSRKFFELDGWYDARSSWPNATNPFGTELYGLALPEDVVENIFYNNFFKFFNKRKEVDFDILATYAKEGFSRPKTSKYHDEDYQTLKEFLAEKFIRI
ncbi:MAG: amidohydrolase family protein [Clostridia bacterium]|nr:amidohydrolase family protein [Clostridia bacterium]